MKLPLASTDFTLAPGVAEGESFHSLSRTMCPTCRRLVDGARVLRGGKVYLRRHCPQCGPAEGLISGDAEWFLRSLTYVKEGSNPFARSTGVLRGCPDDCGLCADHEQHTCMPIIEVTNHCNLECPICIVQNRDNYNISLEDFGRVIDGILAKEGSVETINLSGGEPTLHPDFFALLDLARRPEIARVSVSTNGVRCAADPEFCRELARRGVYVSLQLDALAPGALKLLRGVGDHATMKMRALDHLGAAGCRTTLVSTVARGVNDQHVGDCIRLLYEKDFVLSLMFQPAAHTGYGGSHFAPHNPLDVVTLPDIVHAAEAQTAGLLKATDFVPLPCSHPSCFGLAYLLRVDGELIPFARFLELDRYMDILANRGTIRPDETFERHIRHAINDMWTSADQVPDSAKILGALKRAIRVMYPPERALDLETRLRVGEGLVKTLFIHAFMDEHTFEVERIRKCCTHYALPDGRLMPGCAYNLFHRANDPRFTGPKGSR